MRCSGLSNLSLASRVTSACWRCRVLVGGFWSIRCLAVGRAAPPSSRCSACCLAARDAAAVLAESRAGDRGACWAWAPARAGHGARVARRRSRRRLLPRTVPGWVAVADAGGRRARHRGDGRRRLWPARRADSWRRAALKGFVGPTGAAPRSGRPLAWAAVACGAGPPIRRLPLAAYASVALLLGVRRAGAGGRQALIQRTRSPHCVMLLAGAAPLRPSTAGTVAGVGRSLALLWR